MSYSAMGTMYATAGMGRMGPEGYAPPWRPRGFHSFQGLGAFDTPTSLNVRVVQRGLLAARVSPSPGTADGVWGRKTRASLSEWLTTEAGRHRISASRVRETLGSVAARARTITLPNALASRLEQLSGGYRAPSPRRRAPTGTSTSTPDTTGSPSDMTEPGDVTGFAMPEWAPYALGGAALLGLGGFFLWQGQKSRRRPAKKATAAPALAANRRRRRRRSSRRRR